MREIEFRGYDPEFNKWVYGDFIGCTESDKEKGYNPLIVPRIDVEELDSEWLINWGYHNVDLETVGQYTGLKDENGVKIFEGDILKWCRKDIVLRGSRYQRKPYRYGDILVVVRMESGFVLCEAGKINNTPNIVGNIDNDMFWNFHSFFEVVGNKRDNPELLEVK